MKPIRLIIVLLLATAGVARSALAQGLPKIKAFSQSRNVVLTGGEMSLNVLAEGQGPLHYQWEHNGRKIPGATLPTLTIAAAKAEIDTGWYRATVSNPYGSVLSKVAFVNVTVTHPQFTILPENSPIKLRLPPDLAAVTAIAVGEKHALALLPDGTVRAWGMNDIGQLNVPAGLDNVVAVAACNQTSFALRSDGTVVGWTVGWDRLPIPRNSSNVVQLSAGQAHLLLLTSENRVLAWGWNGVGQTEIPKDMGKVIGVGASYNTSFTWTEAGKVCGWGDNVFAQISDAMRSIPEGRQLISIGGGEDFCLGLLDNGQVVGWGRGYSHAERHPLKPEEKAIAIKAGLWSGVALLEDETAVVWGQVDKQVIDPMKTRIADAHLIDNSDDTIVIVTADPSNAPFPLHAGFSADPLSQIVPAHSRVKLTVGPGAADQSYQWMKNGQSIPGANSASLSVSVESSDDEGIFRCVVGSGKDAITSHEAVVRLTEPEPPSRLTNFSVRGRLGSDSETLNLGLALAGDSTGAGGKQLLVRAVGPSLSQFGLTQVAGDPAVELISAGKLLAGNDDWKSDAGPPNFWRALGAFDLLPGSKDALVFGDYGGVGTYSVVIRNRGSAGGIGLGEVYLANSSGQPQSQLPRMINLSARGLAGRGENQIIVGFVVAGTLSKNILVTGIGSPLAQYGIGNPLADPHVVIYKRGYQVLAESNDWSVEPDKAMLGQLLPSVGSLAAVGEKNAALAITLPPGAYTVLLNGVGDGTGVGLVEVFEIP